MNPAARRLLAACLFFSGASSLIMEVAWSRTLSLVLGNSHQAVATVVASMMTGLFLGSLLAAKKVGLLTHLPRAYGLLEMGIGAYGALTPLIFKLLAVLLGPAYALPAGVFLFVRFLMVFILLLPPSLGMGATLPIVTAALATDRSGKPENSGSTGGLLYGLNTLGAFLGTLAGGFLLLPGFGLLKATLTGAATSFAVGGMVWMLSDSLLKQERRPTAAGKAAKPAAAAGMPLILPLYAASGFLALVYEITWTRVLAPVAGSSVYSFTLILSAILAGIGVGSLLLSTRLGRWIHPGRGFAAGQILLGGVAFLSLWGLKAFPNLMLEVAARHPSDPGAFLLREFLAFGAIVVPPGLILGALFPFASRLLYAVQQETGADVGRVYAWNTAGSLLGSLAAGFLLVETLGSQKTLALACIGSLSIGVAALTLAPGKLFRPVAGVAAALFALMIPLFMPSWDLYRMTTGVTQLLRNIRRMGAYVTVEQILKYSQAPDVRIMFHKEGKTCTVTVVKEWYDRWLRVDGKTDASTSPTDMLTQILVGQAPFFFAVDPKDVAVVGYGSGVTANAVLSHPVRRVDTFEIEEQVIRASPFFEDVNGKPLSDPRHHLIVDDARTALAYRAQTYDIIISEPSNPWMAGVNNLFTTEFYTLVKRRLRPGGVFTQWIQSYELSDDSLQVLLNTLAASFPHAHLFASYLGSDMIIVASERPLPLVPGAEKMFGDHPPARQDLARVGVTTLPDLALLYTSTLKDIPVGPLRNTDDNSLIQYRAPLELLRGLEPQRAFLRTSEADVLALFFPRADPASALVQLGRAAYGRQALPTLDGIAGGLQARGNTTEAAEMQGLADALRGQVERAHNVQQALVFAETRVAVNDAQGAANAIAEAEAAGLMTAEEWARAGLIQFSLLNFGEADRFLDQSVELNDPRFLYQALSARGAARLRLGRAEEAKSDVEAAKQINPDGSLAYVLYASALFDLGRREEAIREIEQAIAVAPEDLRLTATLENYRSAPPSASNVPRPNVPAVAPPPAESSAPDAPPPPEPTSSEQSSR